MHWKLRAALLKGMANLPGGMRLYQALQRRYGLHCRDRYLHMMFQRQVELAAAMRRHGIELPGTRMVEVGTGWVPILPLGFWICGVERVDTYDLNRFLLPDVFGKILHWMQREADSLADLWSHLIPAEEARAKIAEAAAYADRPLEFLDHAGIVYHAPADAADTQLPDHSVDVHYSCHVFEHIPRNVLVSIMQEGRRIVKPGGRLVHFVDPSDHFAHFDPRIARVNFLRFDERTWQRYADNRLAYHNRLRASDYEAIFSEAELNLLESESQLDERSLAALRNGLPLAAEFRKRGAEDLCREMLTYVASREPVNQAPARE